MESGEHYFTNLSGNNVCKYNQLLNFSRDFINGTQKIPVVHLYGTGNNGKTVFMNFLINLAEQNGNKVIKISNVNDLNLNKIFKMYGTDIRYIIIEELEDNSLKKISGIIKELTGGDQQYYKGKIFTPKINFVMISNMMINSNNHDLGLMRRISPIVMDTIFTETHKDYEISEKLLNNKNEIMQFITNHTDK